MSTMYRCFIAALATALLVPAAAAQVQRNFPQHALRGQLVIADPPDVLVNGRVARLAPGSRIRGQDNMIQMSGALSGAKFWVHYTLDQQGLLFDVWILRPEELAKRPWPSTPAEAQSWAFDATAQVWAKP
jgi:hypothetical protein